MNAIVENEPKAIAPTTPATLLEMAVSKGADVDQLTKLMELKERYDASEARKAYVVAMTEFRASAPTLTKNSAVNYGKTNFQFASLDHITALVNPVLAANGLSFGWNTEQGERIAVTCIITHNLGHSEKTSLSARADDSGGKNSIQAIGSTVSYLQRYTLLSALGLATGGQDNDANIEPETVTDEQAADIKKRLKATNSDTKAFLNMFQASCVEMLMARDYQRAIAALNKKAKGQASE